MGTLRKRGRTWFAIYTDASGRRIEVSTKTPSKSDAATILRKLESDAALERFGVVQPGELSRARERRNISEEVTKFIETKTAAGRSKQYVGQLERELKAVIDAEQWTTPGDICERGLMSYVGKLKAKGLSHRKIQSVMITWRGFSRWLRRQRIIKADPLEFIEKPSPERDRRLVRRALSADELGWLVTTTSSKNKTRNGMTGRQRAVLYRTATETGLRAAELRALLVKDLHLGGKAPKITLEAGLTKNGKGASQHISLHLAKALTEHISGLEQGDQVFTVADPSRMAKALRDDLEAAREAWLAEGKEVSGREHKRREKSDFLKSECPSGSLDFHALRHTCATLLAGTGASVRLLQSVLRHSDPTLSISRYGHLMKNEASEAAEKLGNVLPNMPHICHTFSSERGSSVPEVASGDEKAKKRKTRREP